QSLMSVNMGSTVQVELKGEDYDTLQEVASDFSNQLRELDGVSAVSTSIDRTSIEKVIELNDEKMKDAGLTQEQVKYFTEESFLDMALGEISWRETTMPLSIRWQDPTSDEKSLFDLDIPTRKGIETLSNFINLKEVQIPNEISHINGERYITISADVENMDLGTINREIQQLIKDFSTPTGYSLS